MNSHRTKLTLIASRLLVLLSLTTEYVTELLNTYRSCT